MNIKDININIIDSLLIIFIIKTRYFNFIIHITF